MTDTNQASEDALKEITKILLMYKAGLAYEHVEPQHEWLGSIDIEEAKLYLLAIILTEKLKLLDEVIHQSTVNLKSAEAVAGWAEL
jgi:hypothetical protein